MSIQQKRSLNQNKSHGGVRAAGFLQALAMSALLGVFLPEANGETLENAPSAGHSLPPPLNYNVWLDERPMGQHQYRFQHSGERLTVTSTADFKVKVLLVTVFNYQHQATETWRGNCLEAITSETSTNGEEESLDLRFSATDCSGTYTYWDKDKLKRGQLTNAQNGQVETASWKQLGATALPKIGKRKSIRYDGEVQGLSLQTQSAQFNLYYDKNDTLLMMQTDNDGRTITYLHDSLRAR